MRCSNEMAVQNYFAVVPDCLRTTASSKLSILIHQTVPF